MPLIERFSNALSAAKKAWQEPKVKPVKDAAVSGTVEQPAATTYYVDTLSKTSEALPEVTNSPVQKSPVESRWEVMSAEIDEMLNQEKKDIEKLFPMIHSMIMLMMRMAAKYDQEAIYEISIKVKAKSQEIKATYNTWQGLTITVISAGISFAGGAAGLAFTLPASVIAAETARNLSMASQSIGTASTGLSGIGSIFNNRSEGTRQVENINLKRLQDTEEEKKGSKHNKGDLIKSAKAAAEEFQRSQHEAKRAATAA